MPCLPVALNSGLFWPRRSILRKPGTVIVEILDPILEPPERNRLDREPGASYVRHWLAEYNVTVFR